MVPVTKPIFPTLPSAVNFNNNLFNRMTTTEPVTTQMATTPEPNECLTGTHRCNMNAECTDASPGYTCACKAGYNGDGFICEDLDECAQPGRCSPDSVCTNAPGSYVCTCKDGFTGTSGSCMDENECLTGRHGV